jgi:hypothetical protein
VEFDIYQQSAGFYTHDYIVKAKKIDDRMKKKKTEKKISQLSITINKIFLKELLLQKK